MSTLYPSQVRWQHNTIVGQIIAHIRQASRIAADETLTAEARRFLEGTQASLRAALFTALVYRQEGEEVVRQKPRMIRWRIARHLSQDQRECLTNMGYTVRMNNADDDDADDYPKAFGQKFGEHY